MFKFNHIQYLYFALATAFLLMGTSAPAHANIFDLGFAGIMENIATSLNTTPGLVTAASYLLAILFGVLGIVKLKDHVENPNGTALKIPTIHFLVGGGLFALPTVVKAVVNTIDRQGTDFEPAIESLTSLAEATSIAAAADGETNFNEIFINIVYAMSNTPLLIYVFAYLAGIIMVVSALLKLKEHVEDQNKAPLKTVAIRFLIAGALLALPALFNAMATAISPDYESQGFVAIVAEAINIYDLGQMGAATTGNANEVMANILASTSGFPIFVTAIAYFLALVIGMSGIFKIKEHVENEQTPLREGVIRFIIAGGLIALPAVMFSLYYAISGGAEAAGLFGSDPESAICDATAGGLGSLMCNVFASTKGFPFFLTVLAYFAGTAFAVWAVLQLQEHVISPQQVKFWDPFSKMIVAGGLFALPTIVSTVVYSVSEGVDDYTTTGFKEEGGTTTGLDGLISNLMTDVYTPLIFLVNWFGIVAGVVLVFIGITRLMKSSQEGAKGPAGIGTIMTFIAGGALISFSPMVSVFIESVFLNSSGQAQTYASLSYTAGMSPDAVIRSNTVIAAIMRFVLLLGLISIMRGIFIVRGVSEGTSQASMMAGITHIIGGALAVNLGGVLQAAQSSLGISSIGLCVGTAC